MTDRPDPIPLADDAALDRLLATATWPTPDAHAVRRLTQALASERRRRLRLRWAVVGAAAAVVAMAGVCWIEWSAPRPAGLASAPVAVRPPVERPTTSPEQEGPVAAIASAPIGRPPTVTERMLILPGPAAVSPKPRPSDDPAFAAIAPRAIDVTDRAAVLRAAREILTRPGRPADASHDEAVAARLVAVATAADWPLVRAFAERPRTRTATLAALVARRDAAGVDLLLCGVLDPSLQPAVLTALRTSTGLPTALLVAKFDSSRMDERWAAAVALGRGADAETLARLASMAERGEKRRESIAALVASDTPAARALLVRISKTREAAPHVAPAREAVAVLLTPPTVHPCCPALKS